MNSVPKFLTFDQVIALHQMQIDEFGGSPGLKDEGVILGWQWVVVQDGLV